jgi:retron-type reverse transcriptase
MAQGRKGVHDKRVLRLIRRYLEARVMDGGLVHARTEGTPQGSPPSPLLSNVMLDDLDWELDTDGHRFVRYADDGRIYVVLVSTPGIATHVASCVAPARRMCGRPG